MVTGPGPRLLRDCHLRGPIPGHGLGQTILEADSWLITEDTARLRDVGLRVLDVARPRVCVDRLDVRSDELADRLEKRVQRNPAPGRDVDYFPTRSVGGTGSQNAVDDVGDVGEIARVLAVAVNGRLTGVAERADEERDDAGVGRRWILPRTEDVEVADRDRLEAVEARE